MQKCKSCGGVYEPKGSRGEAYYHACPPVVRVAVERDGAATTVPLADLKATDTITVQRGDKTEKVLVSAQLPDDQRLGDTFAERGDKRDENVTITGYDKQGSAQTAAKHAGKGVETVP